MEVLKRQDMPQASAKRALPVNCVKTDGGRLSYGKKMEEKSTLQAPVPLRRIKSGKIHNHRLPPYELIAHSEGCHIDTPDKVMAGVEVSLFLNDLPQNIARKGSLEAAFFTDELNTEIGEIGKESGCPRLIE